MFGFPQRPQPYQALDILKLRDRLLTLIPDDYKAIIQSEGAYDCAYCEIPAQKSKLASFLERAIKAKRFNSIPSNNNKIDTFIKNLINNRVTDQHEEYKFNIYNSMHQHKEIKTLLDDREPLDRYKEGFITTIFEHVYGGTVSYAKNQQNKNLVEKAASAFYTQPNTQNIKLGCFCEYLIEQLNFKGVALPTPNTLKKQIKWIAPSRAKGLGRSPANCRKVLSDFFRSMPALIDNFLV